MCPDCTECFSSDLLKVGQDVFLRSLLVGCYKMLRDAVPSQTCGEVPRLLVTA